MGLGGEKNHKEPILEVPFMIPDSTAVILFPETHKQGNAAERVILLMTLHGDGSASRGEQLSRHQEELNGSPLMMYMATTQKGQPSALKGSLHEFCYVRSGSQS